LRAATLAARAMTTGQSRIHRRHDPPPADGPLHVLMVAMYPRGFTGTKYRLAVWAERLRRQGHSVELDLTMADHHAQRLANDWSARARAEFHLRMLRARIATVSHAGAFHVVMIHMNDLPFWDHGPPFVADAMRRVAGRLVLDLDDLPVVSGQDELAPKARALGGLVDGLIVGNRAVPSHYPGQPWWLVPTCVEPGRWPVPDRSFRSDPPVLGWVGTPGNLENLNHLAPVLEDVCRRHGTKLRVVCSEPADLPGVPQEFVRWTAAGEQTDLEPMDIGLAPLLDAPIQRHKSGLKALQYMASGMPVVAAPVGALREIVEDGGCGLHAVTTQEWTHALDRLITDRDLRLRMGAAARDRVEHYWSFAAHETAFEDALRGLRPHGGP
jgi:Glycosyl transferases group 1